MSLNLGVLSAAVTLSDTQYVNTLDNLEKKSDDTFKKIGDAINNYLTVNALVDFGKKAIQTFSDLEEATNKFNVVFAGFTDKAGASVDELIKKFGQSELSAKQMLSGTGDILTGFGFDRKAALDMSVLAAKLGADLASFSNYAGGAKGASEALTKAMLGETEMAKMLGIVIRQDSDEFKQLAKQAMETGLDVDKSGSVIKVNTEQQAKALAALALAYQQSPNAIGDFERSQDSIANQTQILNNRLTDLYKAIGQDASSVYSDALQGINSLLAGYVNLDSGTKSLINNVALLTGGMILLNKLGITKLITNTAVAIVSGNAHLLLLKKKTAATVAATTAEAAHAAALAATATAANLAVLALAAIAAGLYAYYRYVESKEQNMVDTAAKRMQTTKEETNAIRQLHGEHREHLERLQELSKYEKLTNEEQAEAKKLAEQLKKAYGDLGIAVDELNGKLSVSPEAFAKMEEAQKQNYLKQLSKDLKITTEYAYALQKRLERQNTSRQWLGRKSDIANLRENFKYNPEEQLEQYQKLLNYFTEKEWEPEIEITEKIIKVLKEEIALRKKMIGARAGTEDSADKSEKNKGEERKKLEQIQKAISDVEKTELQIEFDSADTEKKAEMLRNQINEIFQKNKGTTVSLDDFLNFDRTRMTKEQLQALEQILKLRQQENNLIKQGADEAERKRKAQEKEIADARRRKEEIVEQNRDFIAEQAAQQIEIQLKNLQVSGDTAGYNALVQQELAKATQAAAKAQQEYMSAFAKIKNEQTVDKDTEEQLRKLLRTAQDAQQKQRAWEGKLNTDENADVQQEQTRKVVGAWSLAEFSRQQENSVESRIEKNTRETARLLKNSKGLVY